MKGRIPAIASLCIALLAAPGLVSASDLPPSTDTSAGHYYVSLGASLATGCQPDDIPDTPCVDTDEGYADQLYETLRASDPTLRLVKLGCAGESTQTMINGGLAHEGRGERLRCNHPHSSQLAEAVNFLHAHKRFTTLVTIDIGANDVAECLLPLDPGCFEEMLSRAESNLAEILAALREAAGPDVPIVGANFFNPLLAFWFSNPDFAIATNELIVSGSDVAEAVYAAAGSPVADVETAFSTTDFTLVGGIPLNVLRICQWTWMCAPPPFGPDTHLNRAGYGVMAQAFLDALP